MSFPAAETGYYAGVLWEDDRRIGRKDEEEKTLKDTETVRYWGSVKFYKHLILGFAAVIFFTPILCLGGFAYSYYQLRESYCRLKYQETFGYSRSYDEKLDKISAAGMDLDEKIARWRNNAGIPFSVDLNDWNYILVNDWNPLPASYKFQLDVMEDGHQVDYRILEDLNDMIADAKREGMDLLVCSAYRSYERQSELFNESIEKLMEQGLEYKEAYYKTHTQYAVVSYSEHHTGLAIDIVGKSHQLLDERQARTKEAHWLAENCASYGFILRYPKGKEKITGIEFESWHFRYVGKESARFIMDNELTLEEFWEMAKKQTN